MLLELCKTADAVLPNFNKTNMFAHAESKSTKSTLTRQNQIDLLLPLDPSEA